MPPEQAPTRTPDEEPEPSGGREKPTNKGKQPQDQSTDDYVPRLFTADIPPKSLTLIFAGYKLYRYRGRPLCLEEVCGIIAVMYKTKSVPVSIDVFTVFDNPEAPLTIKHEALTKGNELGLLSEVDAHFRKYLGENEDAQDRVKTLTGLLKRLGSFRYGRWPIWAKKPIRIDQLCLLVVLGNWCIQDNGFPLNDDVCKIFAVEYIFHGINGPSKIILELKEEGSILARKVTGVLMEHKQFFGKKVQGWLNEYAREYKVPAARVRIPSDPALEVTQAMEASSLGATAPASYQPGPSFPESLLSDATLRSRAEQSQKEQEKGNPRRPRTLEPEKETPKRQRDSPPGPSGPSKRVGLPWDPTRP